MKEAFPREQFKSDEDYAHVCMAANDPSMFSRHNEAIDGRGNFRCCWNCAKIVSGDIVIHTTVCGGDRLYHAKVTEGKCDICGKLSTISVEEIPWP
jgi:hypothetical protein